MSQKTVLIRLVHWYRKKGMTRVYRGKHGRETAEKVSKREFPRGTKQGIELLSCFVRASGQQQEGQKRRRRGQYGDGLMFDEHRASIEARTGLGTRRWKRLEGYQDYLGIFFRRGTKKRCLSARRGDDTFSHSSRFFVFFCFAFASFPCRFLFEWRQAARGWADSELLLSSKACSSLPDAFA